MICRCVRAPYRSGKTPIRRSRPSSPKDGGVSCWKAIFLTTKILPEDFALRHAPVAAKVYLDRLTLEYVDLLLRAPSTSVPVRHTLASLKPLQEQGRIRHLGLSNFESAEGEEAAGEVPIFCNQVPNDPCHDQSPLLVQPHEMDYLLTAYTPLAHGRVLRDSTLKKIGEAHGKVHVHRVTNRWGYVDASTPERAMAVLYEKLPHPHWVRINALLVSFGKDICTRTRPHCSTCPVLKMCQQVDVSEHR